MRDLEIRGAGNLLGATQSGTYRSRRIRLDCQMVTEAVAEMKGETPEPVVELNLTYPLARSFLITSAVKTFVSRPTDELRRHHHSQRWTTSLLNGLIATARS